MNNGQKSLSINETFIVEGDYDGILSACTGLYTSAIISCFGDSQINMGTGIISTLSSFSASTFYGDGSNLTGISTQDTYVTGGTYNDITGVATFVNNTGGTFNVTGFYTGSTDVYVTAVTFTNNFLTLYRNDGVTLGATINDFVSLNVNGPISATTYYGDGSNLTGISTQDTYVTGGTYSDGIAVFINNTGGTFNVSGFYTGYTLTSSAITNTLGYTPLSGYSDTFVTGGTYSDGIAVFTNNTGGTFNVSGFYTGSTDVYVTGATFNNDNLKLYRNDNNHVDVIINNFNSLTTDTISASTYENLPIKYYSEFSGSPSVKPIVYSANSIAIGDGAEALNENMFVVGLNSGSGATDAYVSNFIGYYAGYGATNASGSNFLGTNAGFQATNSSGSNFFGIGAGSGAINANQSNFFGYNAGGNTTGASYSTLIGYNVGDADSNGSKSIGRNNIIIGTNISLPTNTTNSINIGGVLFGSNTYFNLGQNPFTGASSTGRIGINVPQPTHSLHVSGNTRLQGGLSATTISATTYQNLPLDIRVTGGTYSGGTAVFTNNTGGTFSITGFSTGYTLTSSAITNTLGYTPLSAYTDTFVTGGTYSDGSVTFINNSGGTFSVTGFTYDNVISVAKTGGNFTSIKDAIDSITDSSSANRYTVTVASGVYEEYEINLIGKPNISVVGIDIQSVVIIPKTSTQNIFKMGTDNQLSFMTLSGTGVGYAAISCVDLGGFSLVHKLSMYDNDTHILIQSDNSDSTFYGEYVDLNGEYSYGVKIIANNGYIAYANMENYYSYPTGVNTCIGNSVQGSGATLSVFVGDGIGNGVSGSTNYQIFDYASLNTIATTADNWDYGIRNLNIGGPCSFDIDTYSVVNSITYDLSIEHPNTFGTFGGGSAAHSKINNLSDSVYWAFLDIEDGEFDITRKISITFQDGTHTDASTLIFEGSTMGVMNGGVITHVSGLTFEVSSGFGYLEKTVGDEIYMRVDWDDTQITLLPNTVNYLYFNENTILSSSSNSPDNTTNIILGRVVTDSTSLRFIDETPYNASHTSNLLSTFNRKALGPVYSNGSFVTENVTPYHLNVSAGDYYYSENNFKPSGGTDINFTQYYRDGSTGWITTGTTEVVNGYDDNSGTISPLPLSSFTKHTLYVVGDGVNEKYMLVLGQSYYTTLIEAEGADLPTPPTYFDDGVTSIASIYIQQGFSGITEIQDIRPVIGFKAAGISATALHSNLLGLTSDDHKQYLLVDGARPMTGNLSMGGNAIVSALTVNGVTVESHASRHKNGGDDEIATATPAPSEIPKADTFGKLDSWISDADSSVKGLTSLSVNPLISTSPIAVGDNDPRFLKSISGVTNVTPSLVFSNNSGGTTTISNLGLNSISATTISATTYQNLPEFVFLKNQTDSGATNTIKINQSIFNPSDLLILNTSIFIIEQNADYYVLGDLTNNGVLQVDGTLKVGGVLTNNGTITGSGIIE